MSKVENKILDNLGVKLLKIEDKGFPLSLSRIIDAPKKLYYIGDIELLNEANNIAIVGARNADLYAKHFTNSLVKSFSSYPAVVVSGGAKGIDMTAHVAALENSMPTIIVLGAGILASQFDLNSFFIKKLRETKGSLIISEFEPFAAAQRWTFAYRNRLIAALSKSTVLIQAAKESGSLITAKYALKYKKNLFAFSAQGLNSNFAGNHELLNSGKAKFLNSAEDIISEQFPSLLSNSCSENLAKSKYYEDDANTLMHQSRCETHENADNGVMQPSHSKILTLIESGIHSFEHLKIKAEINPTTLSMLLSLLEVKGEIGRAINGEFFRIAG
ncbi:MAG: DNA-processing protein DprA [Cyanobacteria bacterium REEB446]|nr:DNA-processing protein DprA [Cyanobacteria bacterium REEB446]